MDWQAEPYWQWWDAQMAMMVPEPAPDPELQDMVKTLGRLITGQGRQDQRQKIGALQRGIKHWRRRR